MLYINISFNFKRGRCENVAKYIDIIIFYVIPIPRTLFCIPNKRSSVVDVLIQRIYFTNVNVVILDVVTKFLFIRKVVRYDLVRVSGVGFFFFRKPTVFI